MRAVQERSAWAPRVPNFQANACLKLTAAEQQAILAAERNCESSRQAGTIVRAQPRRGLAYVVVALLAYFFLSAFIVAILQSDVSGASRQSSAPIPEPIQSDLQSQAFPSSGTVTFQNEAITNQSSHTMTRQIYEPVTDDLIGTSGQVRSSDPRSNPSMQVIRRRAMNVRNIFQRNPADEVAVPELEVHGDKVQVPGNEDPEQSDSENDNPAAPNRRTREFKLPKTTWFHCEYTAARNEA